MFSTLTVERCVALWRASTRWSTRRRCFRDSSAQQRFIYWTSACGSASRVRLVSMKRSDESLECPAVRILPPCQTEILEATGLAAVEQFVTAAQNLNQNSRVLVRAADAEDAPAFALGAGPAPEECESILWVLNRPAALNALSLPMVQALRRCYLQHVRAQSRLSTQSRLNAHNTIPAILVVTSASCRALFPRPWRLASLPNGHDWQLELAASSTGASSRASFFCAGGDIREMYRHGLPDGDGSIQRLYFEEEYRLNHLLAGGLGGSEATGSHREPFVQISLLDGIVMGGGVGLSIHGRFRIATENTLFAMPECGIGFHPDVGASWFLPRLLDWKRKSGFSSHWSMETAPSAESIALGTWMAVTGARIQGIDAVRLGIATHYCPSNRLNELVAQIWALLHRDRQSRISRSPSTTLAELEAVLQSFQGDVDTSWNAFGSDRLGQITHMFVPQGGKRSLRDIWRALNDALSHQQQASFARECLTAMGRCSPLSMLIAYESVGVRGPMETSLAQCLHREFITTLQCLRHPDFMEGVRAQLVDKDRCPRWKSAPSLTAWFQDHNEEHSKTIIDEFFRLAPDETPLELDAELLVDPGTKSNASASTMAGVGSGSSARTPVGGIDESLPHSSL
ncbi:hypothetical protein CCYA_CCYA14G3854 [Cyanidiococcus yangmingshanensis]|nr:hypothetical protein CCYA_CCYA14G3854 [Cyanidiococcus yangmingshanensis]